MGAPFKFEVLDSQWTAEDQTFAGGAHELKSVDDDFLRLAACAAAAGAIRIVDDGGHDLDSHIQSQEDGEAALREAMGEWLPGESRWSGDWHDANLAQFHLDVASGQRRPTLDAPDEEAAS